MCDVCVRACVYVSDGDGVCAGVARVRVSTVQYCSLTCSRKVPLQELLVLILISNKILYFKHKLIYSNANMKYSTCTLIMKISPVLNTCTAQ